MFNWYLNSCLFSWFSVLLIQIKWNPTSQKGLICYHELWSVYFLQHSLSFVSKNTTVHCQLMLFIFSLCSSVNKFSKNNINQLNMGSFKKKKKEKAKYHKSGPYDILHFMSSESIWSLFEEPFNESLMKRLIQYRSNGDWSGSQGLNF